MNRGKFPDDATSDEINALLFLNGLRPCPHSSHSHDEEFAECARRKEMNMENKFSESDLDFLESVGISTEPTFDDARRALAQRIAKHQAPAQVKVDPQAAKRQLTRLSLQRLLDASEDYEQIKQNRCRRSNGTPRAWFATAAEAVAFAENPTNTAYHGDVAVLCLRSGCGGWHLSQPHWPDARAAAKAWVN